MKTIKTMQCKACNLLIKKSKIKRICPACGLPEKVFEEFKDKINPQRRFILELDLHPLSVHFTQAIGIGYLLLIVSMLLINNSLKSDFLIIIKWFAYFLPFSIFLTILLGLFDSNIRFKKISTPFLKLKIKYSIILFILSCINALLIYFIGISENFYCFFMLSLIIVGLESILGLTGSKLIHAVLKG